MADHRDLTRTLPSFSISVAEEALSDCSRVYTVLMTDNDTNSTFRFDAVTERDALALSEKLRAAIEEHSLQSAGEH
jgi:hypothetical protein